MEKVIHQSNIKDNSSITIPSSKSLSHRALICAGLSNCLSTIQSLAHNEDIIATKRVLQALGVTFEEGDHEVTVNGIGDAIQYDGSIIDCGESGSTLRFFIPIAALCDKVVRFTGHGKLMERPQTIYEDFFRKQNLLFQKDGDILKVQGPIRGGDFEIMGNVSSQFITGLLFALPLCKEDSVLHIIPPFESESYVNLTLDYLTQAGIQIEKDGYDYRIAGNQSYRGFSGTVEGDDSQMAFFLELACVQQKTLHIKNIRHDSKQGDHIMLEFVRKMGAEIKEIENGYEVIGKPLHGITADLADCPDLGPALFALATQCEGKSTFLNCGRLRIKESDRIACMEEELRKLGCDISSDGDTVIVHGKSNLNKNVTLHGHNDHRIVMALSVLSTMSDNIRIQDAQAIAKSYPNFFEDLQSLGIEVSA